MGLTGVLAWLRGYLVLSVRTDRPHAFMNALMDAGIVFSAAAATEEGLSLCIGLSSFWRLRPAVFGLRARVRVASRHGMPFLVRRALRRRGLLVSLGCGAAALYVLSGYVWFVQVRGADRVLVPEVRAALGSLGLHPGVRRAAVPGLAISRELPVRLPDLSWASVRVQGTLAEVSVAEHIRPSPAYERAAVPGDVVAAEGGRVAAVSVFAGQSQVVVGQEVSPGQVLIAGVVVVPVARSRTSGVSGLRSMRVHAAGTVLVRRWYAAYAQSSRTEQVEVPTGRAYLRMDLQLGPVRLPLWGFWRRGYAAYTVRRSVAGPPTWRSVPLPVEVLTLRYTEVTRFLRRLSVDDAAAIAAAHARALLLPRLPPRARILEERQRATVLPDGRIGVELLVECENNIGVFRPAEPPAG